MKKEYTKKKARKRPCLPKSLMLLFENTESNSKSKQSKILIQPCQYILIFFNLLFHKLRIYIRYQLESGELFLLKLIFFYYLWIMYDSLWLHIDDISNMEFNMSDQSELFLLNSGFKKPKVVDLNMLSEYRVAFAGMVKDAENTLPELIRELQILGCAFKYSHFFVLESNSEDHTREIIKNWSNNPGNCNDIHNSLTNFKSYFNGIGTYVSQGYDLELTKKEQFKRESMSHFNNINININEQDPISKDAKDANMRHIRDQEKLFSKYSNQKIFNTKDSNNNDKILSITTFQPNQEFEEIAQLMQRRDTENYGEVREERYVVYRNFLLEKVILFDNEYYKNTNEHIDFVFWIDMDLRGFDLQMIGHEFSYAWRAGFDVVCGNGVKYTGWYYDSYASVYEDGVWAYGNPRWRISNRIRSERFYEMKSCFGGLAAYSLSLLIESKCKYQHFGWAYAQVPSFARFADIYHIDRTCEHLPLNFCLREHGAKLAVASEAHTFYGTGDAHG